MVEIVLHQDVLQSTCGTGIAYRPQHDFLARIPSTVQTYTDSESLTALL
jgi:hypothetical protein